MKKLYIIILAAAISASAFSLSGCSKKDSSDFTINNSGSDKNKDHTETDNENNDSASADATEGDAGDNDPEDMYGFEYIENKDGVQSIAYFPQMYKQSAEDAAIGKTTIRQSGDFLCLMSSIESYYRGRLITPKDVLKKSGYRLGRERQLAGQTAKVSGLDLTIGKPDVKKIDSITRSGGVVVVHIPNKSQYGKNGAFVMIENLIQGGKCLALIPDFDKDDSLILDTTDDDTYRPIYSSIEILEAAGSKADVYYFSADD